MLDRKRVRAVLGLTSKQGLKNAIALPSELMGGICGLKQHRSPLEPDRSRFNRQDYGSELQWCKKNLEHCCSELKFSYLKQERSRLEGQASGLKPQLSHFKLDCSCLE
jgi:hypothetical protein